MLEYKDVAKMTGFNVLTIYSFVKQDRIPYIKDRNTARFTERGIRLWMESDAYKLIKRGGGRKKRK